MNSWPLNIVIIGLSITSSWGNGHATTYRGLVRHLAARGHNVLFLERDMPWYAANRDMSTIPFVRVELYSSLDELMIRFQVEIRDADLVIVGSYVPEGTSVGRWITKFARGATAFYDIDTPVTMAKLRSGDWEYLSPDLIPCYDMYFSFTGGPVLETLERRYGARAAVALHCSVDPEFYFPEKIEKKWELGYIGTYCRDRQPLLDKLMIEPARSWQAGRFVVAGPLYPDPIDWPENIERVEHIAPRDHRGFYNAQSFTLNLTRADMTRAGFSPSVRLFEAAACGTPIISDWWEGLDAFFEIGKELLVAESPKQITDYLQRMSHDQRAEIGKRARRRILSGHTAAHRAAELEDYAYALLNGGPLSCRKKKASLCAG